MTQRICRVYAKANVSKTQMKNWKFRLYRLLHSPLETCSKTKYA